MKKNNQPFYNAKKSYEENYYKGPFGAFTNPTVYKNIGKPNNKFLNNKVYLPFGIPAGPLLNSKYVNAALDLGFDIVEYKTVRSREYPTNPYPNIVPLEIKGDLTWKMSINQPIKVAGDYGDPLSITNSFGVPSMSPKVWQPDVKKALTHAKTGQLVIVSFEGTSSKDGDLKKYIADWVLTAKLVLETGARVLEANLSCPNEIGTQMLCYDIERTREIAYGLKKVLGNKPLILKMAYYPDRKELKKFVESLSDIVEGFSVINTIPAAIVKQDGSQALPGKGRLRGGVCGAAIKWAGIKMVEELFKLRKELDKSFAIIGVGGVVNPEDYFKYVEAGADCVMSATGAMWNPTLAQEIKKRL